MPLTHMADHLLWTTITVEIEKDIFLWVEDKLEWRQDSLVGVQTVSNIIFL